MQLCHTASGHKRRVRWRTGIIRYLQQLLCLLLRICNSLHQHRVCNLLPVGICNEYKAYPWSLDWLDQLNWKHLSLKGKKSIRSWELGSGFSSVPIKALHSVNTSPQDQLWQPSRNFHPQHIDRGMSHQWKWRSPYGHKKTAAEIQQLQNTKSWGMPWP